MADPVGSIVILNESEPDIDIRRFLNHPLYRSRLTYLRGSTIDIPDLKRASAANATGLFLCSKTASGGDDEEVSL